MPQFLRRFTSPYRALRCLLLMIDIYERQRSYSEATELIELLLSLSWSNCDDPFLKIASSSTSSPTLSHCVLDQLGPCRLGHLLNRYIINQATHRKQPIHALKHIHNYFKLYNNCLCLRAGRRLTICDQLIKLYNNILKEVKQKQCTVKTIHTTTMDSDNDNHDNDDGDGDGDEVKQKQSTVKSIHTTTMDSDNDNHDNDDGDGDGDADKKIKSKAHCKKRRRIVKPKNDNIKNCNRNNYKDNCDPKIEEDLLTSIPALQMDIKEAPKVCF
ncbi:unnamed protein product [Trichobilharzia regenti]|nr:unnamed protein product [Trichobilharzia regenti]